VNALSLLSVFFSFFVQLFRVSCSLSLSLLYRQMRGALTVAVECVSLFALGGALWTLRDLMQVEGDDDSFSFWMVEVGLCGAYAVALGAAALLMLPRKTRVFAHTLILCAVVGFIALFVSLMMCDKLQRVMNVPMTPEGGVEPNEPAQGGAMADLMDQFTGGEAAAEGTGGGGQGSCGSSGDVSVGSVLTETLKAISEVIGALLSSEEASSAAGNAFPLLESVRRENVLWCNALLFVLCALSLRQSASWEDAPAGEGAKVKAD